MSNCGKNLRAFGYMYAQKSESIRNCQEIRLCIIMSRAKVGSLLLVNYLEWRARRKCSSQQESIVLVAALVDQLPEQGQHWACCMFFFAVFLVC